MQFQFQSTEVFTRLKPFGWSFEKSLNDLIKGIRSHSKESPESLLTFLDNAIVECKNELNTTDLETKAMAILKLAYLEMYGFEMSWCNFHILEVMSSTKFQQKRVGYLAAIQSFKNEEDLLILATNQFKKDLNSRNHVEIGLALSGIATIVTPNLSKDINDDVLMKLNHTKPYIRKKAILAMYKIFLQYPDSLRLNFNRVIEKLDDDDVSVVSATINVICEISKKNPKIFVNYLPKFFKILEETKNNWLIIRVLKLFQSLSKVEPRMKKKILPSIVELMLKTKASSLIYECINCIVNGAMLSADSSSDRDTAKLCIEKIMEFFETKDSNLKFVGLLALINTIKVFPTLISKVKGVSSMIMECLTDDDLIIKAKALEVCHLLISEDNIVDLIKVLLVQLIPSDKFIPDNIKAEIVSKILYVGSSSNYANIPNFKWYIAVLKDMIGLTLIPAKNQTSSMVPLSMETNKAISLAIGREFKSLVTRVPSLRSEILVIVIDHILDIKVLENCPLILADFYWIFGEYVDYVRINPDEDSDSEDEDETDINDPNVRALSMGKKIEILNGFINYNIDKKLENSDDKAHFPISANLLSQQESTILVVVIPCFVKIYSSIVSDYKYLYSIDSKLPYDKYCELSYILLKLIKYLNNFEYHTYYEVQERSLSWLEFLKLCLEALEIEESKLQKMEDAELKYFKSLVKNVVTGLDESEDFDSRSNSSEEGDDVEESSEDEEEKDYIDLSSSEDEEPKVEKNSEDSEANLVTADQETTTSIEAKEPHALPMLLTHILPSFFKTYELNPISRNAQGNIPVPEDLDLDQEINSLNIEPLTDGEDEIFIDYEEESEEESSPVNMEELEHVKQERLERLRDDPYYINDSSLGKNTQKTKKLIDLDDSPADSVVFPETKPKTKKKHKALKKEKVLILSEETVGDNNPILESTLLDISKPKKKKKNMIKIDSSNLDNFELNSQVDATSGDFEYDIDLEALRNKLAASSLKPEEEGKKKKKKTKKKHEGEGKTEKPKKTKSSKTTSVIPESEGPTETKEVSQDASKQQDTKSVSPVDPETPTPVTIKKPKSKKKKAVIQE